MNEPPTEAQIQILATIKHAIGEQGYPPTLQEMAAALDISTTAVRQRVNGLVERKLLERGRRAARALTITDAGRRVLTGAR